MISFKRGLERQGRAIDLSTDKAAILDSNVHNKILWDASG